MLEGKQEELSLVDQRLEAFVDVDVPPEWATAAPELTAVDDQSVSSAENVLLEKFASKRDFLMMSLLRRSLAKLIRAFSSIFGKLEKLVRTATRQDRMAPCTLTGRRLCFNYDEATKTRFAILQFLLAAHIGVYLGPEGKFGGTAEDLQQDFMSFIKDAAWFRYRTRTLGIFRRKIRWGLDLLVDHLFPEQKGIQNIDQPMSDEQLDLIEKAGIAA